MKTTKARREFKNVFGQANHFLITALVGLDAIEKNLIHEKPPSFSTSWNPKDRKSSAKRSRIFILKAFLGSAVEAIEMYLTQLNRKPKLLQDHKDDKFLKIYSSAGQSVYKKVIGVGDEIKVNPIIIGLIEILITWRNYTLHYDIDNQIREKSWEKLIEEEKYIKDNFNGLDIKKLKETWEKNKDFTFKETASLIKASQLFVEEIDEYIIQNLDIETYVLENLQDYFKNSLYLQRFKSTNNKTEYLKSVIENLTGIKEFKLDKQFLDLVKIKVDDTKKIANN